MAAKDVTGRELEDLVEYAYRPVWEWLTSLMLMIYGIQASDPQHSYKEGWEEGDLPEFPGREHGMVHT